MFEFELVLVEEFVLLLLVRVDVLVFVIVVEVSDDLLLWVIDEVEVWDGVLVVEMVGLDVVMVVFWYELLVFVVDLGEFVLLECLFCVEGIVIVLVELVLMCDIVL